MVLRAALAFLSMKIYRFQSFSAKTYILITNKSRYDLGV